MLDSFGGRYSRRSEASMLFWAIHFLLLFSSLLADECAREGEEAEAAGGGSGLCGGCTAAARD